MWVGACLPGDYGNWGGLGFVICQSYHPIKLCDPGTGFLTSLCLGFLTYKVRILTPAQTYTEMMNIKQSQAQ